MEKKKRIELLGTIFIVAIVLSSYLAFENSVGNPAQKTTTITIPGTDQVQGSATANIISYGSLLDVNVSCANVISVSGQVNNFLIGLQKNGSISNFYSPVNNDVLVQLGNYTTAEMYNALSANLGQNASCTRFTATQASIELPGVLNVTYAGGNTKIFVPAGLRNYTRQVTLSKGMSRTVGVSVYALVTSNGMVYNNQILVTLKNS